MLNQLTIGACLIVTTVLIHAVCLELILRGLIAIKREIVVRWRAVTIALVVLCVFFAHVIEIWRPAIHELSI